MINKDLMRQWVAALRSRKYKQGKLALRKSGCTKKQVDRYCCLGVLCDLVDSSQWNDSDINFKPNHEFTYSDEFVRSYLPSSVARKISLDAGGECRLVEMNDSGKKFHEIADYLERTYLK